MNLTPESQAKINVALSALVEEIANQASIMMIERLTQTMGAGPAPVKKRKKRRKKRQLSNGTGKKSPPRKDLNASEKAVLKALQKRKGEPVKTGELNEEMPVNRSTISNALNKLMRYGLVKRTGKGRNIAHAVV